MVLGVGLFNGVI